MKNNILFVETTLGWPDKFSANNTKVELLAKGLLSHGSKVTIVNSLSGDSTIKNVNQGLNDGIDTFNYPQKISSKLALIYNLKNYWEILGQCKKADMNNIIILGGPYYIVFLAVVLLAKLRGYKIAVTLTEWASGIEGQNIVRRADYFLYNYTFGFFVNAIFPISKFLETKIAFFKKRSLRIPIIADFESNDKIEPPVEKYFLYCASISYIKALDLVVESFESIHKDFPDYRLNLVLSGKESTINDFKENLKNRKGFKEIDIHYQIDYNQLLLMYRSAIALLIPMQDNIQNQARLSQKIAEYCAAGRPILTNPVGDVRDSFSDKENAFVCGEFSIGSFSEKMKYIIDNPELATRVGREGQKLGQKLFHYLSVTEQVDEFIKELNNSK